MALDIVAHLTWSDDLPTIRGRPAFLPACYVFTTFSKTPICYDPPRWNSYSQERHVSPEGTTVTDPCNEVVNFLTNHDTEDSEGDRLSYSFLISRLGTVYEGSGWAISPHLPKQYVRSSRQSIFICYMGDYSMKDLPAEMANASLALVQNGIKSGFIAKDFLYYDISE